MEKVKVILFGLGSVGQGVTKALIKKKGVKIVGAVDIAKDVVGKDLGEVVGIGRQLGVSVTNDADSLFSDTYADVVIHATSSCPLRETYLQIIKPIEQGMNIIIANVEASEPYLSDPEVAAKLEKLTKKHDVTVLGTGSAGAAARLVIALTEQCIEIRTIKFTTHSDITQFSKESNQRQFGIGLTPEQFQRGVEEGNIVKRTGRREELTAISDRLGWHLDKIQIKVEHLLSEDGQIIGAITVCEGVKGDKVKMETRFEAVLDPEHEYSHKIIIEGVPSINAVLKYSPDRALQGTVGPLVNAIPHVLNAQPGILKLLDLPLSFALLDDMRVFLLK